MKLKIGPRINKKQLALTEFLESLGEIDFKLKTNLGYESVEQVSFFDEKNQSSKSFARVFFSNVKSLKPPGEDTPSIPLLDDESLE
jgi:hypothetical protein